MKPWVVLAAAIVGIDVWLIRSQQPTLSACYRKAYRDPMARPLVVGVTAGLIAHLIENA